EGYSYDYINAEVIENRLKVKDGKLVLPDGISYSLMVLPPEKTMRPEVLKKISQLVADGATILGPRPERSPSLQDYPTADKQVKDLAAKLWQNCDGKTVKMVHFGKGMVLDGMTMEEALTLLKVIPDFKIDGGQPVLYTHRRTGQADIYFVCNQSDSTLAITPSFRVSGKQPEWWDAVDGSTRTLPQFVQHDASTSVPLKLAAYQSGFVVFRNESHASEGNGVNFPVEKMVMHVPGPWKVTFDGAMRGPVGPVIFDQLQDWSKSKEDSIKYYSGTAIYKTTFSLTSLPKNQTIYLDLGNVKAMAQVTLNGENVGSVWTAPHQVNVTRAVKKGENLLTIKVVNTWVNRLIGDSKLPIADRKTHADVNPYTPDSPLDPSGLMGPVTLKTASYTK
ncbi:MAG TPA: glycosyl hydrolase, partial [Chitinophagaceae bacterium]|nr:glycosyl hydrolase [Chitinophagaceae bacterium]